MSRGTAGTSLVKDLQGQMKALTRDLRERSDDADDAWAQDLRAEYERARERGRTGLTWSEWRDGEVDLAAVAWVLATVFVRFCEDNGLIDGPWITGEGVRYAQAADNETAFYQADPTRNSRDWLRAGFAGLADLPAGRDLLDPRHNLVWRAPISADAASALLAFWRTQNDDGTLTHEFTDPTLDTRFLGDLYQDLSSFAKKKYALLQTPLFVEEFILDRTLTPAIEEFGLEGLRLIDPTCGSGHFLLGSFDRLLAEWRAHAPAMDTRERVQRALDSVHGVDLNPFAVAIARFRLTVAALKAAGMTRLKDAPAFDYHLAVGDSLLKHGVQGDLFAPANEFSYANEDVTDHPGILDRGRYHVVVGNPPYITVKDRALNERYRQDYASCSGKYALTVPFMELFFQLATRDGSGPGPGFVGQITSNSFMKRLFGRRLIEDLLSGGDLANPVDLTYVVDTAGTYIPGHGTPTVILIGRHRRPVRDVIRVVLGIRGEPQQPEVPSKGVVWTEIVQNIEGPGIEGTYVSIRDLPREALSSHPWSLAGSGAVDLLKAIEAQRARLGEQATAIGYTSITGDDEFLLAPKWVSRRLSGPCVDYVFGDQVRDFSATASVTSIVPIDATGEPVVPSADAYRRLWPGRAILGRRLYFGRTAEARGMRWFDYAIYFPERNALKFRLAFANVSTHNHFVLDRGGRVFNAHAPVVVLSAGTSEDQHLGLLGVLNSSVVCFWLKQVSYPKGGDPIGQDGARVSAETWSDRYEYSGTTLHDLPIPDSLPGQRARHIDALAQEASDRLPSAVLRAGAANGSLAKARDPWQSLRARLVFAVEELDWDIYRLYGLVDENLTYSGGSVEQLALGERAFEIALARKVAEGSEETAWFERHGSTPITELPAVWPADYRALVQRRLDLIASDPFIGLLERPEYKRRWQSATWDDVLPDALQSFILDRLEEPALWSDGSGPAVLSVAQLADRVRGDADLVEAVRLLRDAVEVDLTKELGKLLPDESVPYLAALRYKDSGLRKRAEWEAVWDLQRREDAGEQVSIPVPPKYGMGDFRKTSYWKARGKLDVPKERFISYPGTEREGDSSLVIGWAGWDHLDQARALARLIAERSQDQGLDAGRLPALVAGLVELEPWLHQWHGEPDAAFGGMSPAVFMTGFIDSQLASLGATRDDARAWRP